MALIECADCHNSVSEAATDCPNCGRPTDLPTDEVLSEAITKARPEAKRAGQMALAWCVVAAIAMHIAQDHQSLGVSLVWLFAMIAGVYQMFRRFQLKNLVRTAESAGARGKES